MGIYFVLQKFYMAVAELNVIYFAIFYLDSLVPLLNCNSLIK